MISSRDSQRQNRSSSLNGVASISVSLAYVPHGCASIENATVGGWPSDVFVHSAKRKNLK